MVRRKCNAARDATANSIAEQAITLYDYIIRQIVPKKVWDTVNDEVEFIDGGFPIATLFVDVASDAYCTAQMTATVGWCFTFSFTVAW